MVVVQPMRIPGRWREGYVLAFHTLSSTYLGDDEFGHPQFDTRRSEVGELLYQLKYQGNEAVVGELVETAARFVESSWKPGVTMLVAVPPSRARASQPVLVLAEALAKRLNVAFTGDTVVRTREVPELKNVFDYEERLRILTGLYRVTSDVPGQSVLLVDDLYRSGATMNAVTSALYDAGASNVFALALTRTRSRM